MDKLQFVHVRDCVEVVRCKNCTNWETDWEPKYAWSDKCHFCHSVGFVTEQDFYCAYGERKDGGEADE